MNEALKHWNNQTPETSNEKNRISVMRQKVVDLCAECSLAESSGQNSVRKVLMIYESTLKAPNGLRHGG